MAATFTPTATIETSVSYSALPRYTVRVAWSADTALDRTDGIGISCMTERDADRLARAINDGAVFYDAHLRTDVYGQTYVEASRKVWGKYLHEDLAAIGY